jgi:hypothetical protein
VAALFFGIEVDFEDWDSRVGSLTRRTAASLSLFSGFALKIVSTLSWWDLDGQILEIVAFLLCRVLSGQILEIVVFLLSRVVLGSFSAMPLKAGGSKRRIPQTVKIDKLLSDSS